jgi:hypothetical protein
MLQDAVNQNDTSADRVYRIALHRFDEEMESQDSSQNTTANAEADFDDNENGDAERSNRKAMPSSLSS